ncbi:universal stress protein [Desulfotruncus alcoholivorax]|uniref:universal stress protein n=1 Tax=Desulfotruncus alcoholivorax TaxID=265477 RepID=UPI00048540B5|nr:universal stress protein [Desulfotruncus alcoholivorax]
MKKYLVAIDGSDNSKRAAGFALHQARGDNDIEITLIHIVNVRKELYNYSPLMDIRDIQQIALEQGMEAVKDQAVLFENEGINVNKVVVEGDPGYKIAECARENGYHQIIIGTRGLSDLKGLVLGSVSHKVVHFAKCPVTLVK